MRLLQGCVTCQQHSNRSNHNTFHTHNTSTGILATTTPSNQSTRTIKSNTKGDMGVRCLHTNPPMLQDASPTPSGESYTHFGYEQVEESEKVKKVYEVFENVATSYDVMNDAMSGGVHRLWKTKFVNQLNIRPRMKVLDMAGGTGDIAFKMFDSLLQSIPI